MKKEKPWLLWWLTFFHLITFIVSILAGFMFYGIATYATYNSEFVNMNHYFFVACIFLLAVYAVLTTIFSFFGYKNSLICNISLALLYYFALIISSFELYYFVDRFSIWFFVINYAIVSSILVGYIYMNICLLEDKYFDK